MAFTVGEGVSEERGQNNWVLLLDLYKFIIGQETEISNKIGNFCL